ncbi:MAG: hypothetical protein FJZ87_05180 [Chloroflexi bacterium]|nr:hypothetical protein [Chloroflexota bacterium]
MKQLTLTILLLTLYACAPILEKPISSDDPPPSQGNDYLPNPEDSNFLREPAFVESTEVLILESYPPQFTLAIKGDLPTPCHKLRIAANPPDSENRILVEVYSLVDVKTTCIAMLESFEVNYPLGSFPAGTYSVWVNGEKVAEIQS